MKTTLATLLVVGLNTCGILAAGQTGTPLLLAQADQAKSVDLAAGTKSETGSEPITTDEAPLTDVIKFLGRQANLNLLMDPKVVSGGVGPDGKPTAVPMVEPLRFENITAEQALEALLANHNLQMITDPKTKTTRVTAKDPNAPEPLETKVMQLKYASPTNMAAVIKPTLSSRSQVLADLRTSQLVIMATAAEFEKLTNLVDRLDTPTKQVLIEARLLETSKNPQSVKGIDWSGTLANQTVAWGNGLTSSETVTQTPGSSSTTTLPSGRTVESQAPYTEVRTDRTVSDALGGIVGLTANTARGWNPSTAFLNADGVRMVLSFLNQDADTEVVATPRAVTLDNETARLEVTRSFPIFQQSPGSAQVAATTQIIYTNVGTILNVTPRISAEDRIHMKVTPEVSNIDSKDRQVVNGQVNEANVYATRRIATYVLIPSGNTLVMGGLISDTASKRFVKVPVLGDIPGLGWAFRHETKNRSKANLLIFITPTIVKDSDFAKSDSDFLRTPLPPEKPGPDDNAWDSGKPHDWSKPVY